MSHADAQDMYVYCVLDAFSSYSAVLKSSRVQRQWVSVHGQGLSKLQCVGSDSTHCTLVGFVFFKRDWCPIWTTGIVVGHCLFVVSNIKQNFILTHFA